MHDRIADSRQEPLLSARVPATRHRRRWWIEVVLVAALYAAYDAVHGLIRGDAGQALVHGRQLLRLEHLMAIDLEHPINDFVTHVAVVAVPACFFYASAHFLVTPAVLVWMFVRRPDQYRRARTVLAALTLLALLGFWLFPTAPPRLLTGTGLHDVVAMYSNWGWWSSTDSAPRALSSIANQYAAFPSLHIAWAMWCGVTLWRCARGFAARVAGALYPAATALVVLGTANHYVLDVLTGAALWWSCDLAVSHGLGRRDGMGSPRWTALR